MNESVEKISEFVSRVNYHGANIPEEGLIAGIYNMSWMDIIDEFDDLEKIGEWASVDASVIRKTLESEMLSLKDMGVGNGQK